MVWHRTAFCSLIVLCLLAVTSRAAEKATFVFTNLTRDADSYYEQHRPYTGLTLRDRHPAIAGARTGYRESRILGRSLGVKLELAEVTLGSGQDAPAAIEKVIQASGSRVFILDLPIEDVMQAASAFAGRDDVILFNVRHRDDALRTQACSSALFHTIASNAMLMDALAQYLSKKSWKEVLVLEGEAEADRAASLAFQRAAKKFRLDVVEVRPFMLSNDPRVRDQTNIALLTGSADYDVVFLADEFGEFGRYVPYRTLDARPVIGSEGLVPSAWHWTWERYGAPQLNQRFDRIGKRRMNDQDWAAWAAIRSVVEAMARTGSTEIPTLRDYLVSDDLTFDAYKGTPGSFRPWNQQLRQPILLHTHNAVVARAPIDGFLHQKNNLDTLGIDERESACRLE